MRKQFSTTAVPLLVVALAMLQQLVSVEAIRNLRIVSPLQALTICDPEVKEVVESQAPRKKFLARFRAGLSAEAKSRAASAEKRNRIMRTDATSGGWADKAESLDRRMKYEEEVLADRAYDRAAAKVGREDEERMAAATKTKNPNKYQFVGVINPETAEVPITWYARKKPANAKWSVRLVHVNRDAIVKDLFARGKADIFASYENTGKTDSETGLPVVTGKYSVRERSWKNLWNFSPKQHFTDSSGMFWRERRLRPGLYTDGKTVYAASYRYRDGRNGMHRYSSFEQFLGSKNVDPEQKERIQKRLREDTPDVVLEE